MSATAPPNLRVNRARLWDSIMAMAEIGATAGGGSCRLALTDEDRAGRDLFAKWCRECGCDIHIDELGNIFAAYPGREPDRLPVGMGSHLDTQPHGGRFDGIFGVLAGLEVVRTLRDHGIHTAAPLEIIDWTNEEGSRFAPAMLASGVYGGQFDARFALSRSDAGGRSVGAELQRIGYAGSEPCGAHALAAFLEVHIEQGPILERHGQVVGVVTGAQGVKWCDITVRGRDAHTGSTPMTGRRDALVAAAQLIQGAEEIAAAAEFAPHAVATVGELHVRPNSRNTIPGEVWLSLDLRHPDDARLTAMAGQMAQRAEAVRRARGVEIDIEEIWHNPPVRFDADCIAAVQQAADQLNYTNRRMVSGAGHDACQVARKVPTAMIFVPCEGGLSHNEGEFAEPEHLEAGANTLLHAALKLAGEAGAAGRG